MPFSSLGHPCSRAVRPIRETPLILIRGVTSAPSPCLVSHIPSRWDALAWYAQAWQALHRVTCPTMFAISGSLSYLAWCFVQARHDEQLTQWTEIDPCIPRARTTIINRLYIHTPQYTARPTVQHSPLKYDEPPQCGWSPGSQPLSGAKPHLAIQVHHISIQQY